jgi:cystathionine beta-lyase/cystathionine gamma-synthase
MNKPSRSIFTQVVSSESPVAADQPVPSVPPIVTSVGFIHPSMDQADHALGMPGGSADQPNDYIYARHGAPTQAAFEAAVATLEGAETSLSFGSGMAALHAAVMASVPSGGCVIAAEQLYGTTRSMLLWLADTMNMQVDFVDFLNPDRAQQVIAAAQPQAVVCEILTNPLARVVRIDAIVEAAKEAGASVIVDNTFATPFLLRPLELGVDLVAHSATKFINGHGDVLGGVVSGSGTLMEKVRTHRRVLGGTLGPFEAWLALRGMRTFALRMQQACQNAMRIARWLNFQPRISKVYYPGLDGDSSHTDAAALFRENHYGAMLAFDIDGADRTGAFAFVEKLKLIRPVTSLGDVNSLIAHPASASHRGMSPEARAAQGILEGTLRISIGIEDAEDLIADLGQALEAVAE